MSFDKTTYEKFGLTIELEEAQKRFMNKSMTLLFHTDFYNNLIYKQETIVKFCLKYGLEYIPGQSLYFYINSNLSFVEFIIRLNCLFNILSDHSEAIDMLSKLIKVWLHDSPVDLGIKIIKNKSSFDILPSGSEYLDKELVENTLSILEDTNYKDIRLAYEKGLREFLLSSNNPVIYLNVIRDMQLSLDEVSKVLLKDKNTGFKHLLKNDNWRVTRLDEYYKRMFFQLNEMIDKLVKHKSGTEFSKAETESIIYLTGIFIRLTCS